LQAALILPGADAASGTNPVNAISGRATVVSAHKNYITDFPVYGQPVFKLAFRFIKLDVMDGKPQCIKNPEAGFRIL